jgi:DnaJ-class molecular chaperone
MTTYNGQTLRVQCPDCKGTGRHPLACETCGNAGSVPERTAIEYGLQQDGIDRILGRSSN